MMAVQTHDARYWHHKRFAPGHGDHDRIHLPPRSAEVCEGGDLQPVPLPLVHVRQPRVGHPGRPGREHFAAVAAGQRKVTFG